MSFDIIFNYWHNYEIRKNNHFYKPFSKTIYSGRMNIALIGYGSMGKVVERIAIENGLNIVATIDPSAEGATHKEISKDALDKADVCIDFTTPESAIENIRKIAGLKKNVVVATTGWYDNVDEVKKIVEENGIGLIYAPNFSIGVNLFYRIVENAASIMNNLPEYDVYGIEMHHNRKKDSPSGTARKLGEILLQNIDRKKKLVYEKLDRKIEEDELHFASVRGGGIPGTHIIGFDSKPDSIELKHTARDRSGFAAGALKAAEWIKGKKGFYSIDDLIKEIVKEG